MQAKIVMLAIRSIVLTTLILAGAVPVFAQVETLDATAMGTSTTMGRQFNVKVTIRQYSTPEDRQTLMDAFLSGGGTGLERALSRMKSVGRVSLPGTVGYDISYAIRIDTPTGRKVRFVTNRRIAFGESRNSTRSKEYNLSAGEFDLNDQDKSKSTGVLLPAAQLILNQDGELQMELFRNPWRLTGIIDWNNKGGK